ncbi:hypothetical protein BU16DRAFT_576413 [Lophium mytilinum]|uniref:DUF1761-domain-containing protein n=1 Tax=Lophium mytilinum TaxID=390894 RepID=A0A6A6RF75_9PEZI|nr:hypothetical protein BU16DRAFT_576413 [Lophium mytilinum]
MSALLVLPPATLSLVSAYGLYHSYQCIVKLRQYEEKSEKAAEYSNTAAEQLHKTRTTQGSAAISIIVSFLSSTALVFASPSTTTAVLASAVNLAATLAARVHVKNFWDNKAKVPFTTGYNEAISGTAELVKVLGILGGVWAVELVGAGLGF